MCIQVYVRVHACICECVYTYGGLGVVLVWFLWHIAIASWKARVSFIFDIHITLYHRGKSGQELKKEPGSRSWGRDHRGTLHSCSAHSLVNPRTTFPLAPPALGGITAVGRDFSHQLLRKCPTERTPSRITLSQNLLIKKRLGNLHLSLFSSVRDG